MLLRPLALVALLLPASASGQRETTRAALERLEESLAARQTEGAFETKDLLPAIVVSAQPAFEESKAWYPTAALATLVRVFGAPSLRSCEACRQPRLHVEKARLEQNTADLSAEEIARLDQGARGSAAPARTALWLDENAGGVSLRIVDLANSRIVLAENFDPRQVEPARTRHQVSLVTELDRRASGDSITHAILDLTVYPSQHLSLDWVDQWGDTNANLSGVSISFLKPALGVGGAYYRIFPSLWDLSVGAKVLLSLPTALVSSVSDIDSTFMEPLLTGVLIVRLPLFRTNYGLTLSVSTNLDVGIGLSLLNISLLPFLP